VNADAGSHHVQAEAELSSDASDRCRELPEIASLRRVIELQVERIDALASQVAAFARGEAELRARVGEIHQLLSERHADMDATVRSLQVPVHGLGQQSASARSEAEVSQGGPSAVANRHRHYQQLVDRIREVVKDTLPSRATVVVVSKGDEALLRLPVRQASHFPQSEDGRYAGHNPADSAAAIAHLEQLRRKGADYLLFPEVAFWWLDYYAEFTQHLESHYHIIERRDDTCLIYALREPDTAPAPSLEAIGVTDGRHLAEQNQDIVRRLLPPEATVVVVSKGDEALLRLPVRQAWHFPQDDDGRYAGHYPADSAAAIAHLEEVRARGGQYLLLPQPAFWWLEHYPEFAQHLTDHYRLVARQEHLCLLYALDEGQTAGEALFSVFRSALP
jgi:hypothetical protein